MRKIILMMLATAALGVASAQDPVDAEPGEAWLKQHLEGLRRTLAPRTEARADERFDLARVDLLLIPSLSQATLSGEATLCVRSLQEGLADLALDLHDDLAVSAVDGATSFTHAGGVLNCVLPAPLALGEEACVTVHYAGNPQATGFGSYSLSTHAGVPLVATLSEPNGAPTWWPTKDDPSDKADSADVRIVTPLGYTGTSNGTLLAADTTGATVTWHWRERHPIATYLVCMSVTNYVALHDNYMALDGSSMPVVHYVYPEHVANATEDLSVTVPMIGHFAATFGEYPFVDEKYGHSVFGWGGAMEHQCNTSYGATLIRGDHAYDYIVAHELAHQWWGDKVTCAAWEDIWLNEGFATYSEALWKEHLGGHASLVQHMTTRCAVTDPSGPIYDPPSTFNSNTVYRKGAWLLHMTRGQMGDPAFFALLRDWADGEFAYASAHVADFTARAAQFSPHDLTGLWNGFLYGLNRPVYRFDWRSRTAGGLPVTELRLRQMQSEAVFNLRLPFRVTAAGTHDLWRRNHLRSQGFVAVTGAAPTAASLDPDDWILDSRTTGNLNGQLRHLVFRVQLPDGSFPGAGGLRARCGRTPGSGAWVEGLEQGVVALELREQVSGWVDGDSLWIEVETVAGAPARLQWALVPTSADWQDLGVKVAEPTTAPFVGLRLQGTTAWLGWEPVPGATAYRVESATHPDGPWQTLGETSGTEWEVLVAPVDLRLLRVRAVY
jgi:aminopeptidase N